MRDPELEEREQRFNEWRVWKLETLHRELPFRMAFVPEWEFDAKLRRIKSVRVRQRLLARIATFDRGACSLCQAIILIPFAQPAEPLRICLPCAKRNLRAGDILFVDPTSDAPPAYHMKPARKRRPRGPDER